MKRLIVCCDGTRNRLDAPYPTNVVKFAASVAPQASDGTVQTVCYVEGVGTGGAVARNVEKLWGGAFGKGLERNIEDAYRFLIFNYEPGDEIFVIDFSRGAYTARSLVGLVRNCGILHRKDAAEVKQAMALYRRRDEKSEPDADEACKFRYQWSPAIYLTDTELKWRRRQNDFDEASCIRLSFAYVGVWDTVGALGVPNHWAAAGLFNKQYKFHDHNLSSTVRSARHAVAIDERRRIFEATRWENLPSLNDARGLDPGGDFSYLEQWFPGDHGSVGGGGDNVGLSDGALDWIAEGARKAGLVFNNDQTAANNALKPDHKAPLKNISNDRGFNVLSLASTKDRDGPQQISAVSKSAKARFCEASENLPDNAAYRPGALKRVEHDLMNHCGAKL